MFRSRLIFRLEQQIEANINDPGFVYEALKVYLMLGGLAPQVDEFVMAWMRNDWADNLPGRRPMPDGRQALEEHLQAMFDLDVGHEPAFTLNKALIEDGQRTLARMSVAERAYELLKSQARGTSQRDWVVAFRGGSDVGLVFEARDGARILKASASPASTPTTASTTAFLGRLASIGEQIDRERWVLGEAGKQQALDGAVFGALLGPSAPLQPRLRRRLAGRAEAPEAAPAQRRQAALRRAERRRRRDLADQAAPSIPCRRNAAHPRASRRARRQARCGRQGEGDRDRCRQGRRGEARPGRGKQGRARSAVEPCGAACAAGRRRRTAGRILGAGEAPGANIEAQFKAFHVLLEGDGGKKPVDMLMQNFTDIGENLAIAATNKDQAAAANNALVQRVATLRANASRFPPPFDAMIRTAANEFEGDATGATVSQCSRRCWATRSAASASRSCRPAIPS